MNAFMLLLLLAAAVVVLGLLVIGVVLLVLGISRKRTGLWVTGLVMLLLPACGLLLFLRAGVRRQRQMAPPRVAVSAQPDARRTEFEMCTGLELPRGASIPQTTLMGYEGGTRQYFRVESAEGLPGLLVAHFTPATWGDLEAQMSIRPGPGDQAWWPAEKMQRLACYRRTYTNEIDTTCEVYAAFDQAGSVLYLLAVEKPDAGPADPKQQGG